MSLNNNPSRIDDTERKYYRRALSLARRCRKLLNIPNNEKLDYRRFVGWLVNYQKNIEKKSWRQYKSSVVYFLNNLLNEEYDNIAFEALEYIEKIGSFDCETNTIKTSSIKLKRLPLNEYKKLDKYLEENSGGWHEDIRRWLASSILTGLRPIEWKDCELNLKNGELCLDVKNAKNTNGRANGEKRTIILSELTSEEKEIIRSHIKRCKEWSESNQYEYFYHAVAGRLGKINRKIWPQKSKRITLYSARHQFSADSKASGFTKEEVAAMMGHAVENTATKHYGRKSSGYQFVRVRPIFSDVERVKKLNLEKHIAPKPNDILNKKINYKPKPKTQQSDSANADSD